MGMCVCGGAMLQCSFGLAPGTFQVTPQNQTITSMPIANIMDHKPMVNIMPFGMCQSLSNPQVAAATSAAWGVLTPMPCVPNTASPWMPGAPSVLIANFPALNDSSTLMCAWGGVIQIIYPGQTTINIP